MYNSLDARINDDDPSMIYENDDDPSMVYENDARTAARATGIADYENA